MYQETIRHLFYAEEPASNFFFERINFSSAGGGKAARFLVCELICLCLESRKKLERIYRKVGPRTLVAGCVETVGKPRGMPEITEDHGHRTATRAPTTVRGKWWNQMKSNRNYRYGCFFSGLRPCLNDFPERQERPRFHRFRTRSLG